MGNILPKNEHTRARTKTVGHNLDETLLKNKQKSSTKIRGNSFIRAESSSSGFNKHSSSLEIIDKSTVSTHQFTQRSCSSLGAVTGGSNWSLNAVRRNLFSHNKKLPQKNLTNLQGHRCKTAWHRPLTNAIFRSHFNEVSRISQFKIEHLVANGSFGVVFKVSEKDKNGTLFTNDNRASSKQEPIVYALKVLRKSKILETNSVQQVKDETNIHRLCGHHPFIVQLIDCWQNRRYLYILSEYISNGELFYKISHFSLDLIRFYLAEIALAIDFLHNAGVIYRDAKPENILLTANYHIKLTDFGLSKWLRRGATTKTMCGTLQYMAPEIFLGEPYGHTVDWWSVGIILYRMLLKNIPDIGKFLNIDNPIHLNINMKLGDAVVEHPELKFSTSICKEAINKYLEDLLSNEFIELLPHESRDALRRLLQIEPKNRIHSVLALQRIALYKNFSIELNSLMKINVLNIFSKDNIKLNDFHIVPTEINEKYFENF